MCGEPISDLVVEYSFDTSQLARNAALAGLWSRDGHEVITAEGWTKLADTVAQAPIQFLLGASSVVEWANGIEWANGESFSIGEVDPYGWVKGHLHRGVLDDKGRYRQVTILSALDSLNV